MGARLQIKLVVFSVLLNFFFILFGASEYTCNKYAVTCTLPYTTFEIYNPAGNQVGETIYQGLELAADKMWGGEKIDETYYCVQRPYPITLTCVQRVITEAPSMKKEDDESFDINDVGLVAAGVVALAAIAPPPLVMFPPRACPKLSLILVEIHKRVEEESTPQLR